ncbi:MAG: hypothetical protein EBU61_03980 [Crocinitomicaceae bacterium]|nr:hypothetical protein [Crocinitomicaceae bacterium]
MKKLLLSGAFAILTMLAFGQKGPRLITFQDLITTELKAPKVTDSQKTVEQYFSRLVVNSWNNCNRRFWRK